LKKELGEASLCLILGIDAFAGLPNWHRWQEIFNLCHIIAVQRPDFTIPSSSQIASILQERQITDSHGLQNKPSGYVFLMKSTLLQISASDIRHQIANQKNPRYLLPDLVLEYIREQQIYLDA
jgi:nicotinate-nucleotide adenylyltransferase